MKKNKTEPKTLNGNPATQKNVTLENTKIAEIEKADRLKYMSFSAYVNKLIDADLLTAQ
jgi:hypothetical protein